MSLYYAKDMHETILDFDNVRGISKSNNSKPPELHLFINDKFEVLRLLYERAETRDEDYIGAQNFLKDKA